MSGSVLFVIHDLDQNDIHYPAWAGYLAASLQQAGAECEVYDMAVYHYTNEQLAAHLDDNEYDLILVGFLCARYVETVQELLQVIAAHASEAHLNIGGHCASAEPVYFLNTTPIDSVCVGEAEETVSDLLECVTNGFGLYSIDGIAYRKDKRIVETERRKLIRDLDSIPFPAYKLFDMEKYSTALHLWGQEKGDRCIGFTSSRGCVGECSFCHRLEKGVRFRSAENVVDEMEMLWNEYGITGYFLYDEMFVGSKDRLRRIKQELDDRGMRIKFSANARVDGLTQEKMELLKEMGCTFLNLGVESANDKILTNIAKNTTVKMNVKAIELAKEFGINTGINMLWNCPGDTEKTLRNNVDFLKTYQDYSQLRTIRFLTPYPGSPIYYQSIQEGKLKGPADFFERFKNSDLITVSYMNGIMNEEAYKMLFDANRDLVMDHQRHTNMTVTESGRLIEDFRRLYFEEDVSFRGSRHYDNKNM